MKNGTSGEVSRGRTKRQNSTTPPLRTMPQLRTILSQGLEILCKSDEDIERLIAPRTEEILSLLCRYIGEIELFNPAYGLVGAKDTNELAVKHILDSLAPAGIISRLPAVLNGQALRIADAGSGAGLPGIPLAIVLSECEFTLIERMGRRAGFLFNTIAALSLSNAAVEESELEKAASGRFNLITFRAFKPLEPRLLKTLFKACAPDGIIAAYKGRRENIEAEIAGLQKTAKNEHKSDGSGRETAGGFHWEIIPYSAPFLEEERHLLVIKHIG